MLNHFPRPPQDTGRGVHWSPNQYLWGKEDWGFWQEQLQAMNIKWVKLLDDGSGSVLGLVRRLVDLQIMPVIRFYREQPNPGRISARETDAAKRFVELGAVYFETNNEPDLDLEWKSGKRPANWLDIVVDNFIIEADMIRNVGGYLLFPAFGPGGRGNPFQMMVQKGRKDLLDGNCCLAIHNYCLGRPLDYPNDTINTQGTPLTPQEWADKGGMWAWEMSYEAVNEQRRKLVKPKANIMEDSTCFRAFEYFDALVNQAVGHSIPIFTTEGGYSVGQRAGTTFGDDPRYPKPTPEWTGRLTDDMFRYIEEKAPAYYFACMPWLIAVQRMGVGSPGFENQGPWFTNQFDKEFGLKGELPVVAMLKKRPGRARQNGPLPTAWQKLSPGPNLTGRKFDDRFKYLQPQVQLDLVADPSKPHWRLVEARWADEQEAQGKGYVYLKALNEAGQPIDGATFQADRGDAVDRVQTKGQIDQYWGNYLLTGLLGTYKISMAQDNLPSERLVNVGLGTEAAPRAYVPTAFFLTFQKVAGVTPPPVVNPPAPALDPSPGSKPKPVVAPRKTKPKPQKPPSPSVQPPQPKPGTSQPKSEPTPPQPGIEPSISAPLDFKGMLIVAGRQYILALNRQSPLYKYARAHRLGHLLSAEYPLVYQGVEYRAQVFDKGIVYIRADGVGPVGHIKL